MAYQIKQLAALAGVSIRTLRYYDEIGLLKPAYVGENGYRYYETAQVDRLQQICLYRTLQVPLTTIKQLLRQTPQEVVTSLNAQYQQLLQERQHLDQLLQLMQTTIHNQEGISMTDDTKFEAFKAAKLAANEQRYGDELRTNYDAATLQAANQQFAGLSAADYQQMQVTEQQLMTELKAALALTTVAPTTGQAIVALHRQWLSFMWPKYNAVMHRGLATMYLNDDRFQNYYDQRAGRGAGVLLAKLITKYAVD